MKPPTGWQRIGRLADDPTIGRTLNGHILTVGVVIPDLWWAQVDRILLDADGGTREVGTAPSGRLWRKHEEAVRAAERYALAQPFALEDQLRHEIEVSDALLNDRDRVLNAIPECPVHGSGCVPHALEWIAKAKEAMG